MKDYRGLISYIESHNQIGGSKTSFSAGQMIGRAFSGFVSGLDQGMSSPIDTVKNFNLPDFGEYENDPLAFVENFSKTIGKVAGVASWANLGASGVRTGFALSKLGVSAASRGVRASIAHKVTQTATQGALEVSGTSLQVISRGSKLPKLTSLSNIINEGNSFSRGADNFESGIFLNNKLSHLETIQQTATRTRTLLDGRKRYYLNEIPSRTQGETRGASYVLEYNPSNSNIRGWYECYDIKGNVNRVHLKNINGSEIISQHYPPTQKELIR